MVENPNRKVEKLLPEERLGGNGLFARITVFPGREIDYHEHHGETETYHIIAGEGVYGDNGAERAIYAETGSLTDRKKPAKSYVSRTFWYARLDSNQRPLESELSGCQAANRCGTMVWWVLHKFAAFYEKTSEALRHKASEVFRSSSQIVVWIKCGFSSPVQLNIFTLYPWIRSAASHPSTLARSSTIPACAFASSYCFCS